MTATYVTFEPLDHTGKTNRWTVLSVFGGDTLGYVHWRSGWRKYVFSPAPSTDFDDLCLRVITDFIARETTNQRATWKRPPKEVLK